MKHPDKTTTPPGGYVYTQPETGARFHYFTWAEILLNVGNHRLAMGLDTTWEWNVRLENDYCEQNPHIPCTNDSVASPEDSPIAVAGRLLWGLLHDFTLQYPEAPTEDDKSNARYWLSRWAEKIPSFGCNCRSDWARLVASYAPDLSSRDAFVRWASNSHDNINRKLGKPIFRPEWFDASPAKDI